MKLALLSDIHANLEALTVAMEAVEARTVEAIYCLGDLVGYGPDAVSCVDLIREHCMGVVCGNHDVAVALDHGVSVLPADAQRAVKHNREQLSEDHLDYLRGLPLRLDAEGCTFVHATPQNPGAWRRLGSFMSARIQFEHFETAVCFFGHSHIPAVMANKLGVVRVRPGLRYLINVGSVGQPRDGDPRLCVAFFDTETFDYELVRLPYDVDRTASKILAAGLPLSLAERLRVGL